MNYRKLISTLALVVFLSPVFCQQDTCLNKNTLIELKESIGIMLAVDRLQNNKIKLLETKSSNLQYEVYNEKAQHHLTKKKLDKTEKTLRKSKAWYNDKWIWFGAGAVLGVLIST